MLLLSGIGLFFSAFLLVYNKGYKSANIYLGLFLFAFNFVTLSHYLYIFNQSKVVLAFMLSIPINAPAYAIGPLAFLYVRSILRDNAKFTKYDGLHFLIFFIILASVFFRHFWREDFEKFEINCVFFVFFLKFFRSYEIFNILAEEVLKMRRRGLL